VIATVDDKECAFFGAQNARPTTIEMTDQPAAEDDGVVRRDCPRALRTRRGRLFRHLEAPREKEGMIVCR
jgi:hypothetical protein